MANAPVLGNSRLFRVTETRINAMRETIVAQIGAGVPSDYAAYRHDVGYLKALDDVIAVMAEIDKGIE